MALAVMTSACATTKVTEVWKDPAYQSTPKRIMVIVVAKKPMIRIFTENEFVQQLKARGTDALPTYIGLPQKETLDKGAIVAKIQEMGADAVLIVRYMDTKVVMTGIPNPAAATSRYNYQNWYDYYSDASRSSRNEEYAILQTNLYDAKTEKLVWTASSETYLVGSRESLIRSFIATIVKRLSADQVVR
jgi:hypothetical protein